MPMYSANFKVEDERRRPRHAVVYYEDWNTPRFRMLTPAARCLYVTLAMFAGPANSGRASWPKGATLAAVTGFTEGTIYNLVAQLKAFGYLKVGKKRFGLKRISVYTLQSPPEYPPPPVVQ